MRLQLTIIGLLFYSILSSQPIFVNAIAAGNDDGSSWENAYIDLQDALASAQYGDTLWVARGTYLPTTFMDRSAYFQIPNGVALFGGFLGVETVLTDRDWENNETILSGDIGITDNNIDNVYTVVYIANADSTTTLDGVTVTAGYADVTVNNVSTSDKSRSGGGIYILGEEDMETAPMIRNCLIKNNQALANGGGVYCFSPHSGGRIRSRIYHNKFEANYSYFRGGAIAIFGVTETDKAAVIDDCDFLNNESSSDGGGIYCWTLDPSNQNLIVSNCYFERNTARSASCLYIELLYGDLIMTGCTLYDNSHSSLMDSVSVSAIETGQAEGYQVIFENIYFDSNVVEDLQYGYEHEYVVTDIGMHHSLFKNCTFVNNGNGLSASPNSRIENCVFDNNWGEALRIYSYYENSFPAVVNSIFSRNGGAAILARRNINISNCIFYKNRWKGALETSFSGANGSNISIFNSIFDTNEVIGHDTAVIYLLDDVNIINCISTTTDNCELLAFRPDSILSGIIQNPDGTIDSLYLPNFDPPSIISCENIIFAPDPLFVDPENGDFHLLPGGPAIDAGYNPIVDSLEILTDFEGNIRTQGGSVDIGPYESYRFSVSIDSLVRPNCRGEATGTIHLSLSGVPPYTYAWENGETSGTELDGLLPGTYQMTITDASEDVYYLTFDMSPISSPRLTTSSGPIRCADGQDGRIEVTTQEGVPPFVYLWTTGDTSSVQENLTAGIYVVTVVDDLGCSATTWVELFNPDSIYVEITTMDAFCFDNPGGTVTIETQGGTPPYTLSIDETNDFSVGDHPFTVTDQRGCVRDFSFTIQGPDSIFVETILVNASTETTADGRIQIVQTTGGTAPYTYLWSTGSSEEELIDLLPGTYSLTVSDEIGCEKVYTFEVSFVNNVLTPQELGLEVQISPNPVDLYHPALLNIQSGNHKNWQITIFNTKGQLIQKDDLNLHIGKQQYALPLMSQRGQYFIRFRNKENQVFVLELLVL